MTCSRSRYNREAIHAAQIAIAGARLDARNAVAHGSSPAARLPVLSVLYCVLYSIVIIIVYVLFICPCCALYYAKYPHYVMLYYVKSPYCIVLCMQSVFII